MEWKLSGSCRASSRFPFFLVFFGAFSFVFEGDLLLAFSFFISSRVWRVPYLLSFFFATCLISLWHLYLTILGFPLFCIVVFVVLRISFLRMFLDSPVILVFLILWMWFWEDG
jgi:hypothetical protein